MTFNASETDITFRRQVENCEFPVSGFGHRAHLRLAYAYLTENSVEKTVELVRDTLKRFLAHHGVDPAKYHETMTRAWVMAVHHFMHRTGSTESADQLIDSNPDMLDSRIMMTHYSADLLFSNEARAGFVQPDLDPIPVYPA